MKFSRTIDSITKVSTQLEDTVKPAAGVASDRSNESIFNLASTINLNNVPNKYYDNNTSSYIIYEEQNKFMNNACISGNCLDFNEYNKLKNINNNIICFTRF